MRYQYVVILKRDSGKAIDFLSLLLCFFSVVSFLFVFFTAAHINYLLGFVAGYLLKGIVLNGIIRRKKGVPVYYKYYLLAAALGWLAMPVTPWLCVVLVFMAFLEGQAKYPLEIGFDQDRVVINTLIKQRHDWSVFNNIVLKDGLLTLDFKSNRLLQKEVADDEDEDDADEEEFNAFCRARLAAERSVATTAE